MYDLPAFQGEGEKPIKDSFLLSSSKSEAIIEDKHILYELDPAQELTFDLTGFLNSESKNLNILSTDTAQGLSEGVYFKEPGTIEFDSADFGMTDLPEYKDLTAATADQSGSVWNTLTVKPEDISESYSIQSLDDTASIDTSISEPASPTVSSSSSTRGAGRPTPYSRSGKKKVVVKGSEEYTDKRYRNNVAVRKSRAKAKERQKTTESRVQELGAENDKLQKKIDLLTKELNVLKGLFVNVGAALPESFTKLFQS